MAKKILWMSRHRPTARQIQSLRVMYGADTVVEVEPRPFDDARQIARRFKEGGFHDLVVVAPLSVLAVLCDQGLKPLWSQAAEENDPAKIEFRGARGQGYRFVRFRRVKRVAVEFED
ncbi:MAG: hypothetical protein ABIB04_03860 [Patescibacteria group bacterium]